MINIQHGKPEPGLVPWLQMYRTRQEGKKWWSCLVGDRETNRVWRYHLWPDREEKGLYGLWLRPGNEKAWWYGSFWEVAGKRWWLEGLNGLSRVLVFVNGGEPELSFYHCWSVAGDRFLQGHTQTQEEAFLDGWEKGQRWKKEIADIRGWAGTQPLSLLGDTK